MAKEALRYLRNARELLGKSPVEEGVYTDRKYVKSACGVVYLGVLEAINEHLLRKGVSRKELPKKVEEYEKALKKYASIHNGKLPRLFDALYEELHIAGYYRGNLRHVNVIKETFNNAKLFIEKIK